MPRRGEPRWDRGESIVRKSAPPSSKWVAKEYLRAWLVTRFSIPAGSREAKLFYATARLIASL